MTIEKSRTSAALKKIEEEVIAGLAHGHFEIHLTCKIGNAGRRELIVQAGRHHRFLIGEDEITL
jgi:hypothetical protein